MYLYVNIFNMECLENIIGVTRSHCNCPQIDDYRDSESGYYFDESAYSYDMRQWEDIIGCQDLSSTIKGFIDVAIEKIKREIAINLNEERNYKPTPISVQIGQSVGKRIKLFAGDTIVIAVKSVARGKGAVLDIENLEVDSNIQVDAIVSKSNAKTTTLNIVANVLNDVEVIDTKSGCSTCASGRKDGISVTTYRNGNAVSRSTLGFVFDAVVRCSYENVLCGALKDEDTKKTIGAIIQKIAVSEGLKYLIRSNNFSRYTVMNMEVREEDVHKLKSEYTRDIKEWLIPTLGLGDSICFGCKTEKRKISKSWF